MLLDVVVLLIKLGHATVQLLRGMRSLRPQTVLIFSRLIKILN